jgi:hypothetical protein
MNSLRSALLALCFVSLFGCGGQSAYDNLAAQVALHPDGLLLLGPPQEALLPFGATFATTVATLTERLGQPQVAGRAYDCGAEYMDWESGLVTYFDSAGFAGWSLRASNSPVRVSTQLGISTGTPRSLMEQAYLVVIEPSTLGTEFIADGISGLLDAAGPDAKVTDLWAGNACIYR